LQIAKSELEKAHAKRALKEFSKQSRVIFLWKINFPWKPFCEKLTVNVVFFWGGNFFHLWGTIRKKTALHEPLSVIWITH
jgi:hypothetical protein